MCIEHYLMGSATSSYVYIRSCLTTVEHFSLIAVIHNGENKIQLFNEEHSYSTKTYLVDRKVYH